MKNYLRILRLMLLNLIRGESSEKKGTRIATAAVLVIACLFLTITPIIMIVTCSAQIVEAQMQSQLLTLIFCICELVIFFFGIRSVLSVLYFSKDNEFLATLPISTSTVFFAKLSSVYLGMLAIEAVMMLPILTAFGICLKMSAIFYVVGLLAIIVLPALPLMLASIIALPLMFFASKFKNRSALSSVVMIIMFFLLFGAYFFLIMSIQGNVEASENADIAQMLIGIKQPLTLVADILLPISSIARLATLTPVYGLSTGLSALVNVAMAIGFTAVLIGLSYLLSHAVYRKASATIGESTRGKVKAKQYRSGGSAIKALLSTEWKQLIRTPVFAIQSLMMIFFVPLILVIFTFTELPSGAEEMAVVSSIMFFCFTSLMGVGMNFGASTCITREGGSFAFGKSLAVSGKDRIKAKRILYMIFCYIAVLLASIVEMIMAHDFLFVVSLLLYWIPYTHGFVSFSVYFDLCEPNLKWTNPNEAMKKNFRIMIPFIINAVITIILTIALTVLQLMTPVLIDGISAGYLVLLALMCVGSTVFAVLMKKKSDNNCERLLEKIDC